MNETGEQLDPRPWYRLHVSSWVVMLIAMAILTAWNVSGFIYTKPLEFQGYGFRHGWPFTFLTRTAKFNPGFGVSTGPLLIAVSSTPTPLWGLRENVLSFRPIALAADFAITLVAVALVVALFERRRRSRPRLLSFSLKEFLVFSLLVACALGYRQYLLAKQRTTKELLSKLHLTTNFGADQALPAWLWAILPADIVKFGDTVTRITYLDLSGPDDATADLASFAELRHLSFGMVPMKGQLPRRTLVADHLSAFKKLELLDLSGLELKDDDLAHIESLSRLQVLRLGLDISDAGLAHLADLSELFDLQLSSRAITDKGLAQLTRLQKLKSLVVLGSDYLTNAALASAAKLPQLETLSIESRRITDEGLPALRALTHLESLETGGGGITDQGLKTLGELGTLKTLVMNDTNISDAGLPALKKLTRLKALALRGSNLTDNGVEELIRLPALESLVVRGGRITPWGVGQLNDSQTRVKIIRE